MPRSDWSGFFVCDPVQRGADGTAAFRAIRIAAEHARGDASAQISRVVGRNAGEGAIGRARGRAQDGARHSRFDQKLRILTGEPWNCFGQTFAVFEREPLRALLPALWGVNAHPDSPDFRALAPEFEIPLGILKVLDMLSYSSPMDVHASLRNVT